MSTRTRLVHRAVVVVVLAVALLAAWPSPTRDAAAEVGAPTVLGTSVPGAVSDSLTWAKADRAAGTLDRSPWRRGGADLLSPTRTTRPDGVPAAQPVPEPEPEPEPEPAPPRPTATAQAASGQCAEQKCIALTFDDGPVAGTAALLDLLRSRGVHATFFVVGENARAHPDLLRRMAADGHAVENHTYTHARLTRLGTASIRRELVQTNDVIESVTGVAPAYVRPPYGATDDTVAAVARELGMGQVTWDVDPVDWKDHDSDVVRTRVLAHAHPGAIVLSHDIHATTRAAYPDILDTLIDRGYTFVTVPELLGASPAPGTVRTHG